MGNQGQRRTTVVTEEELTRDKGPDPIGQQIRAYIIEGEPLPEDFAAKVEVKIKVQKLDRKGRVVQGANLNGTDLDSIFDTILDEQGPGRYNFWVNYRPVGSDAQDDKLVRVSDITVSDDPQAPGLIPQVQPGPVGSPDGNERSLLMMMMQQAQQQNQQFMQLMMAQQQQMTSVLVALIQSGGGNKGAMSPEAMAQLFQSGIDVAMAAAGLEPGEDDDDPGTKLIKFGSDVIGAMAGKPGDAGSPENRVPAAAPVTKMPPRPSSGGGSSK